MTLGWQQQLQQGFTDPKALLAYLDLKDHAYLLSAPAHQSFKTKVPLSFAARMEKQNINDPLLKQVLPVIAEEKIVTGYDKDPLQEKKFNPLPGLLHKYTSRVLITLTPTCAINCRYCFRKHFAYQENNPNKKALNAIIEYIQNDPGIVEVCLSGGDPLIATDEMLGNYINQLATIEHLKIVRIHSRLPIVLPARITPDLIKQLTQTHLKIIMVTHCNHPNELNEEVRAAIALMGPAGIHTLNQSVLLADINDNADILCELSYKLFDYNIMPYYMHFLDQVQGVHHFEINHDKAFALYQHMLASLPGYLVPKFVVENPDKTSKTPLFINNC